jgi:hypothetical protein
MPYQVNLTIIAFGDSHLIKKITKQNLAPKYLINSIKRIDNSVIIKCSYKIDTSKTIIEELLDQLQGLSYFLEICDEIGYAALYYKKANQTKRSMLFEIMDCISNDFLEGYKPCHLNNFDSINLDCEHINLLRKINIGIAYTNLLINPNCYK